MALWHVMRSIAAGNNSFSGGEKLVVFFRLGDDNCMCKRKQFYATAVALALIVGILFSARPLANDPVLADAPAQDLPPVEDLIVLWTKEMDLMAGPVNTAAFLAPNGEHFAHFSHNYEEICIYATTGEEERWITPPRDSRRIDLDTVRWSPDSRYLALTSDFYMTLNDSDLWLLDAETAMLQNLTDDQFPFSDSPIGEGANTTVPVDLMPVWSKDSSHMLFLRLTFVDTHLSSTDLYTISPDGSDLEQVGTLKVAKGTAIRAFDWSGSQIVYSLQGDDTVNGVWISDLDGSNPRRVAATDLALVPYAVTFSPDAQYVLTYTPGYLAPDLATYDPALSPSQVIALGNDTNQIISTETWVSGAGWAPGSPALAYLHVAGKPRGQACTCQQDRGNQADWSCRGILRFRPGFSDSR
jgi:WD40 repeat protein